MQLEVAGEPVQAGDDGPARRIMVRPLATSVEISSSRMPQSARRQGRVSALVHGDVGYSKLLEGPAEGDRRGVLHRDGVSEPCRRGVCGLREGHPQDRFGQDYQFPQGISPPVSRWASSMYLDVLRSASRCPLAACPRIRFWRRKAPLSNLIGD